MDAPIGREGGWIAAEPGLQREQRGKGRVQRDRADDRGGEGNIYRGQGQGESKKGKDLGGVGTTPVRSLEAGAFRMEVWVSEFRLRFFYSVAESKSYDWYEL